MPGLAVLTCAKILRNAGARVTDDVLRTLIHAAYLLDVRRAMVIAHTDCRTAGVEADVHQEIRRAGGPDTRGLAFLMTEDPVGTVREDIQRLRSWPSLRDVEFGGFLYDVATGRLMQVA